MIFNASWHNHTRLDQHKVTLIKLKGYMVCSRCLRYKTPDGKWIKPPTHRVWDEQKQIWKVVG